MTGTMNAGDSEGNGDQVVEECNSFTLYKYIPRTCFANSNTEGVLYFK